MLLSAGLEIDTIIERDTTGGRSLSPIERLNQVTSFSQTELNNLLNAMSTLPSISSYPMVTPAVTKPRQLAPTVGRVSKGVTITGEAQRGTKNLIIGKVTTS